MNLKGSETEKNLYKTFAGESRANTKYSLYAEQARKEGYRWVAEIFEETAGNEKAHAREVLKKYLCKINNTEANLRDAAKGEAQEANRTYKDFENVARKEGFYDIADFYKELQEVEEAHEERFIKLADKIKEDEMFKSIGPSLWKCMNCGYIHEGTEAPKNCPLCNYPKSYFKPYCKVK